jgi:hypothetical protein
MLRQVAAQQVLAGDRLINRVDDAVDAVLALPHLLPIQAHAALPPPASTQGADDVQVVKAQQVGQLLLVGGRILLASPLQPAAAAGER